MTTKDQGAAITSADQIGKVFMVVGGDVRRCLVCEEMFTRKGASTHFNVICHFRVVTKDFEQSGTGTES